FRLSFQIPPVVVIPVKRCAEFQTRVSDNRLLPQGRSRSLSNELSPMRAITDRKLATALRRVVDARMAARGIISVLLAVVAAAAAAVAPVFLAQMIDGLAHGRDLPVASAALYLGFLC